MPAPAAASPAICKSKRSSKKKTVKKRAAPKKAKAAKPKITALTIAKWQKQKLPQDQIVEKAMAGGYQVTKLEKKKLLKYKVKKPLIAKLEEAQKAAGGGDVEVADATPASPSFDPNRTMNPNDIDFDSVPPPKGMPADLAKKQKEEAGKKPLVVPQPAKSDDKPKRVVIAAQK